MDFRNIFIPYVIEVVVSIFHGNVTIERVCLRIHLSDNRETMSDAENNWLPVDFDIREKFCDDKIGLRAFSRER